MSLDVQEEDMNGGEYGRDTAEKQSEHSSQMSRVVAPLGCLRLFALDYMKRVLYTKTTSEGEFFFFSEIYRLPALIYSPFVCVCVSARELWEEIPTTRRLKLTQY